MNILIAEDNLDNIRFYEHFLDGYRLTICRDGQTALETWQKDRTKFDVIVTDYNMPHLDGLGLIQKIREQDKTIPIYMLSASSYSAIVSQLIPFNVMFIEKYHIGTLKNLLLCH